MRCDLTRAALKAGYRSDPITGRNIAGVVLATIRGHARHGVGIDRRRVTDEAVEAVEVFLGDDPTGVYRCTLIGAIDTMIDDLLEQLRIED